MHLVTLPDSLAPELPSLSVAAFEDVPFINFLRPKHREYPEYLRQHVAWKIRLKRNQPRNVIKVCLSDDSDEWWDEEVGAELLGYAVWDRRGKMDPKDGGIWGNDSLSKKFERVACSLENGYITFFELDPTVSYERNRAFEAAKKADRTLEELSLDGKGHMWLFDLAVRPKYQRKGVGKKLLQWGVNRADQEGVAIGLKASSAGLNLYKSVGFEEKGVEYAEAMGNPVGMIRQPRT